MKSILRAKIAHIATGDIFRQLPLLNQLESLQQAGYEVVGISTPGPDAIALQSAGIRHIPALMNQKASPGADLVSLWRLYWVLRREQFTLVHVHTPKAELLGSLAARLAGVPLVVDTFRGIPYRPEMRPLWRRLFIGMSRLAAGRADVVLSQSQEALQLAVREKICPPHKLKHLGNGIDIQRFDPGRITRERLARLRVELGITLDAPVVGFVGRLAQEKGVLELLEAARIVQQQIPQVRFLFIGPLDEERSDDLKPEIARKYGLTRSCLFTGLRHDMPELYALMDIFVLPSHRESFPHSLMEASAMGVPCLVTDIPGCREVVAHDQNGLLVPLLNPAELAKAIFKLLTDPTRARQMGEAGRRLALERFDERLIFSRVKAEYARLLAEKGLTPVHHELGLEPVP